jgi:multimeric flavodoxin WrbA
MTALTAIALNCTLKPSPAASSSELIARQVLDELAANGVDVSAGIVRVVDHDVRPGVEADMGRGDEWPMIRERVFAADILVMATPTWLGHRSSVAQRVFERLDAHISETDDAGRPVLAGKVAVVAVVGNEDGAHSIIADAYQALADVGYTLPAMGATYWNGEAMGGTDYNQLAETPSAVAATNATAARHAAHLAGLLKADPYPGSS